MANTYVLLLNDLHNDTTDFVLKLSIKNKEMITWTCSIYVVHFVSSWWKKINKHSSSFIEGYLLGKA